jgi:choline kinase
LNSRQQRMSDITTALILAAGPGSRLLPQTADRPKCLTTIAGHAILDYQIAALRRCGITDVVIVVGYLSDRIREFVDSTVTFVDNVDYATTNSSYSLWLARHQLRDGFIHLNSDLLFEPRMLQALLDAPAANAVVVERRVSDGSDMMKATMDGPQILRMGKQLTEGVAEVVGPAKFGAAGAALLFNELDRRVASGQRNQWAYGVFGELAADLSFSGVDNPGCFWAEVDTVADAEDAERRIPRRMIELVEPAVKRTAVAAVTS